MPLGPSLSGYFKGLLQVRRSFPPHYTCRIPSLILYLFLTPDSRVSSRARRHRRSRKHTPDKSSARSSRHALSCPIPRTPRNVLAPRPYIPSRSSHTSVPWYATPPLSVGRERWSSVMAEETPGVMQSSRRADASRKRPLDEGRVHSGDSIDVPARKKLRATPRSARQY